jgi:formylglycine-generating enzyme required for sulfatase activity
MLQWDAANRAGTRARFFFGENPARLSQYAITTFHEFEFKDIPVAGCRQKMPNDYGFFDLLGNASEWCEDETDKTVTNRFFSKALRGGDAARSSLLWFESGALFEPVAYGYRNDPAGIRLVLPVSE